MNLDLPKPKPPQLKKCKCGHPKNTHTAIDRHGKPSLNYRCPMMICPCESYVEDPTGKARPFTGE